MARDAILIVLALISLWVTPKQVRAGNEFNFDPIAEVAKLFAGIFITIALCSPCCKRAKKARFQA